MFSCTVLTVILTVWVGNNKEGFIWGFMSDGGWVIGISTSACWWWLLRRWNFLQEKLSERTWLKFMSSPCLRPLLPSFYPLVFASKTAGVLTDEPPNTEALKLQRFGARTRLQSWPPSCKAARVTLSHSVKYFQMPWYVKYAALLHLQLVIDAGFFFVFFTYL